MKFEPRRDQIIGRTAIRKARSSIIRIDETKVTKFILIDGVGPDAAARGIKAGDLIVPLSVSMIVLDGLARPILKEESIAHFVDLEEGDELLVQTENGLKFVPMDSPDAAVNLGGARKTASPPLLAQASAELAADMVS